MLFTRCFVIWQSISDVRAPREAGVIAFLVATARSQFIALGEHLQSCYGDTGLA